MNVSEKLSKAVQVATISSEVDKPKPNVFDVYIKQLKELFPLVHKVLTLTKVNEYALVYHWESKDKVSKPIIMTAHYDVVPIEEATIGQWKHEPFSGEIADGFIWGRGTLDTKVTMISAMEAAEKLLAEGFEPSRDIYLAFGHDEEIAGTGGAIKIVEYFKEKGISFEYLIDEGGCITTVAGVNKYVAAIGIAEKGYADVKMTIKTKAGHSSTPPKNTSVGLMSKVIVNLENHQLKMSLDAVKGFFSVIGPHMNGVNKIIVSNLWLFGGLFKKIFSKTGQGNAMLRTTTAPTMIQGSMKPNVLPEEVSATVNFRIAPHESVEDIVNHIKKQSRGIPIDIELLEHKEPSAISSSESLGFKLIDHAIKTVFGDIIVAPYLTMARTDARNYEPVAENMYRFAPYIADSKELATIHGVNERISVDNIEKTVKFYEHIYRNC